MSRILLVDDSPHAQRMGERILTEEGFEVVTVSNADSALIRLDDVDPDVVLADTVMPGHTGYDICQYLKMSPRHKHVRVILTAGVLEPLDEANVKRVQADGTLKKPFEASALVAAVKQLAEAAASARAERQGPGAQEGARGRSAAADVVAPFVAVIDSEQVRAAVTIALDASMAKMADEITARVLAALSSSQVERSKKSEAAASEAAPTTMKLMLPEPGEASSPQPAMEHLEPVRRVRPLRMRSGSILGLEMGRPEPPKPPDAE
jgi:CheY-like chemotaxis protein